MNESSNNVDHHGELSKKYGLWAELSGLALVVGLLIALYEAVISSKPIDEKWLSVLSEILIVGGVGFELLFGRWSREAGDRIVAEANRIAEEARENAANALRDLEQERGNRIKYAAAFAWRRIEPTQSSRLIEMLSTKPADIHIAHLGADHETFSFALHFKEVFERAGWKILWATDSYIVPPFGVIVPPGNDPEATGLVRGALSAVGMDFDPNEPSATNMRQGAGRSGAARIVIGHRMTPDIQAAYAILLSDK